jgi:hypothetical protein
VRVLALKVKTAISVYKNFGALEIFSLLAIKLKLKSAESIMDLSSISNIEVIEWSSLTFEFLNDLFQEFNLNSRGEEIFRPIESNIKFSKSLRDGFFEEIYDLGPGALNILSFVIFRNRPNMVLETGVAAGKSSSLILAQLGFLDHGKLISVDITDKVGELIEEESKKRWSLVVLKPLFKKFQFKRIVNSISDLELFLHDSNHSPSWQLFEVKTIMKSAPNCRIILVDDITRLVVNFFQGLANQGSLFLIKEPRKTSGVFIKNGI